MKEITLTRGLVAIVDDADYESMARHRWCIKGSRRGRYAKRRAGDSFVLMHREIMNAPAGVEVDHANGDTLDNRRINLRLCTSAENHRNYRRRSERVFSSRFKGVSWDGSHGLWRATIKVNRKNIHLGRFADEVAAAEAYNAAALRLHGAFACPNAL